MIRSKKLMQSFRFFPLQLLLDGKMRRRRVRPRRYEIGKIIHYKYKAEHRRLLNKTATILPIVLPQDLVTNNVLPFLELPSYIFEGENHEDEEDADGAIETKAKVEDEQEDRQEEEQDAYIHDCCSDKEEEE